MRVLTLVILLMLCTTAFLFAQATNLFISEYVEGTSYQKAIEIFNGTGAPVDLSAYKLKKQTNGAGNFGSDLALSGILQNNDVYVIVNSTTGGTNLVGQPYVDLATTSQAINFNGNDCVALYHNEVQIDVVGIVNQVENWGMDMTLVRNPNIFSPTINFSFDDWTQHPVNTFSNLGTHTFTGGSTDPLIIVTSPNTAATWYLGQTYTISWSSANVTQNIKIELFDGSDYSTLAASIENTGSWQWFIPETHPVGNQFKVKISAIDNSVSDMSDEFFTIAALPVVDFSTIAQLRQATADGTTVYRVTGDVVLTYKQTYRNKKWFQDATGGIEIDDPNGIITTQYQIGDAVSNIIGKLNTYNELLQFTPFTNFPAASSSGNDIIIPIVTVSELNTNFEAHESRLVMIENASFVAPSGVFATGQTYDITDGTGQIVFRTNFFEADYIGQVIPSGEFNMRVITTQYLQTYQVTARSLADFMPVSNFDDVIDTPSISQMSNYPNPFNNQTTLVFRSKSPQPVEIVIYNTKGQLIRILKMDKTGIGENSMVWDGKDENGIRVSNGIYMYNVKGGRYTSTKKMIMLK